ncbi:MAG: DUF58 domain-containing protein, partial [Candidatus Nanopelagicales bacterium]
MSADRERTGTRTRVGLTGRGRAFLVAGAASVLGGIIAGWTPAVQFGALVALLPVAAGLLTRNPASDLVLERQLSARELPTDEVLVVSVGVHGRLARGRTLLLEDVAPAALGGPHRFALDGAGGRGTKQAYYQVRVGARGMHLLGPMRIHVVDPFGMVHRVISTGPRDEVIVHPTVVELDPVLLGGVSVGSGSAHIGARGATTDDVIPREYRPGDEVRRIDWKASARTGGLMVRSEENPWRASVTLVLDLRIGEHRGVEPRSSVDAALSMAASIGWLALGAGWDLNVRTTDDTVVFAGSALAGVPEERRELLLALARVPLSRSAAPSPTLSYSTHTTGAGPLVLIAGHLEARTAHTLASIRGHGPIALLVAVAAEDWTGEDWAGEDWAGEDTPAAGLAAEVRAEFGQAG